MFPTTVKGYFADQRGNAAFSAASAQFTAKPSDLMYLYAVNVTSAMAYVELHDSAAGSAANPQVLPCPPISAGGFASWNEIKMDNGIFVRAANAASGGSAVTGMRLECGWMDRIV